MKFVFLVYVSRSGSTLLARHLAEACGEMLVIPESRVVERLMSYDLPGILHMGPDGVAAMLAREARQDPLVCSPEALERIWPSVQSHGLRGLLEGVVGEYARRTGAGDFRFAVVKWGQIVRLRHRLRESLPDAAFIHVYRDPRAVANSMMRSARPYFRNERMGRGDPVHIGRMWARFQATVRRMRDEGWQVQEVRYEDFCARPGDTVSTVLAALGAGSGSESHQPAFRVAEAEVGVHALVDSPPLAKRVDAWRTESPRYVSLTAEYFAGEELCRRGYPPLVSTESERLVCLGRAMVYHLWKSASYYWRRAVYYARRPRMVLDRLRLLRARQSG